MSNVSGASSRGDGGMSGETAQPRAPRSLVQEYLELIREFRLPALANSQGKEGPRSQPAQD